MLQKNHFISLDDFYAAVGYGNFAVTKAIPKLKEAYLASLTEEQRISLGYRTAKNKKILYDPEFAISTDESGQVIPNKIAKKTSKKNNKQDDYGIVVKGLKNCLVRLSSCCNPVHGDPIIGYISRGKGVAVHRKDCSNIRRLLADVSLNQVEADKVNRLIECSWGKEELNATYQVKLKVIAHDRANLLSDIFNAIAEEKLTIISGQMEAVKDITARLNLTIEINQQSQFDRVSGRIKAIRDVLEVRRL